MFKTFTQLILATLFCFSFITVTPAQGIVINEVVSSNKNIAEDEFGEKSDWIELYNKADQEVNLKGYYLSDDASKPLKWQFTKDILIAAKGRITVWASDVNDAASGLHTNFKIGKEGEPILLSSPEGVLVDELPAVAIPEDMSYGRYPDGSPYLNFFPAPTIGAANTKPASTVVVNELMASNKTVIKDSRGKYEDWVELYNHGELPVNLGGFYITDDEARPDKWQFPNTVIIAPGDFLLVWASDQDGIVAGEPHTNFKIGKEGEIILLSDAALNRIDSSPATELDDDESFGRTTDGGSEWAILAAATPGKTNLTAELEVPVFTGVAEVHINTNGRPIDSKDTRIEASMILKNSATSNYPKQGLYEGKIGIRGRGNTSWGMPKKPYSIELWDDEQEGIDAPILDMPAEEDWALIANYPDKSLMRNFLAYDLSNKIGTYAPRARFVDVFLNEEYVGNYLLTENIKRGSDRVPIKKLSDKASDQEEPAISGGYLLELTPPSRMPGQTFLTTERTGLAFEYKYPKEGDITEEQIKWITGYLNEFEDALFGSGFTDPDNGYNKYIDTDSFIDWILINELARNNDAALHASVYVYKDRDDKLKLGPVWDFDIAFGNINYNKNWATEGWYLNNTSWFNQLFKDPAFVERYIRRWNEIKPQIDQLPETIDATAEMLRNSADKNFERWPILGKYVWPNPEPIPATYQGEIDYLKNWIITRTEWIDNNIEYLKFNAASTPFNLACEPFSFGEWASNTTAGTFPEHMTLLTTTTKDPGVDVLMDGVWAMPYDLTKRSRISGLDEDGISFINTGDTQDKATGYSGAALLTLNTSHMKDVSVSWTGGTVAPNNRIYALRMQYRVGTHVAFKDVLDKDGNVIEYIRAAEAGHSQRFEDILLPEDAANQPIVQIIWKYYQVSTDIDGSRAELRLDDISVSGQNMLEVIAEGGTTACEGETITLSTSSSIYNHVVWYHNEEKISNFSGAQITVDKSGEYSYRFITDTGCTLHSGALTVSIAEKPASPIIEFVDGSLVAGVEGVSYIWQRDGEQLEDNPQSIADVTPGTYTVQVISEDGCTSEVSEPFIHTVTSSVEALEADKFILYPNPGQGKVFIRPTTPMVNVTITVTDITGKVIYTEHVKQLLETKLIDLSATVRKGLHFVNINSLSSSVTYKLIIQ